MRPLLLAGVPLLAVLTIAAAQLGGGVAWLKVVRRWLDRRLVPPDEPGRF